MKSSRYRNGRSRVVELPSWVLTYGAGNVISPRGVVLLRTEYVTYVRTPYMHMNKRSAGSIARTASGPAQGELSSPRRPPEQWRESRRCSQNNARAVRADWPTVVQCRGQLCSKENALAAQWQWKAALQQSSLGVDCVGPPILICPAQRLNFPTRGLKT